MNTLKSRHLNLLIDNTLEKPLNWNFENRYTGTWNWKYRK